MNIKHLQACSQMKSTYKIVNGFEIEINVDHNPYDIPLDRLFTMALRKNKKRRFLFVSTILGKHIPVNPYVPLLGGAALALHYLKVVHNIETEQISDVIDAVVHQKDYEKAYCKVKSLDLELPEKALFIGFAETATALGHAMFDCFSNNGQYIHTTRESILDLDVLIKFEEEHSHATSHRLYANQFDLLDSQDQIVLVDDEITTGKTALNIIEAIQTAFPRKKYVIVSLLDWRSEVDKKSYDEAEQRLGIEIISVSLVSGTIMVHDEGIEDENKSEGLNPTIHPEIQSINISRFFEDKTGGGSANSLGEVNACSYINATGRFGINAAQNKETQHIINEIGVFLRSVCIGEKTLCLGTGEFMFLPMLIAAQLGNDISYHSTTRSPIYPIDREGYGARNAYSFENPDDPSIMNYLYNIPCNYYDNLYLLLERSVNEKRLEPMLNVLGQLGIPKIFIIYCSI